MGSRICCLTKNDGFKILRASEFLNWMLSDVVPLVEREQKESRIFLILLGIRWQGYMLCGLYIRQRSFIARYVLLGLYGFLNLKSLQH